MADTIVNDATPVIQDEGLPNIADGNEDWGSAGLRMILGLLTDSDGSYVRSDSELAFTNHDGTNDEVDVTGGVAYLDLSGETVEFQTGLGGSSPSSYDGTLPTLPFIPVVVETTAANISLQDSTLSDVWLAYATDGNVTGVAAGDVYIRSDDTGSVSAPPHPYVKLGEANADDASADVLTNRYASPIFETVTAETEVTAPNPQGGTVGLTKLANMRDVKLDSGSPYTETAEFEIVFTLESADSYIIEYEYIDNGGGVSIDLRLPNVSNDFTYYTLDGTELTEQSTLLSTIDNNYAKGIFYLNTESSKTQVSNGLGNVASNAVNMGDVNTSSEVDTVKLQAGGTGDGDWTVNVYNIP